MTRQQTIQRPAALTHPAGPQAVIPAPESRVKASKDRVLLLSTRKGMPRVSRLHRPEPARDDRKIFQPCAIEQLTSALVEEASGGATKAGHGHVCSESLGPKGSKHASQLATRSNSIKELVSSSAALDKSSEESLTPTAFGPHLLCLDVDISGPCSGGTASATATSASRRIALADRSRHEKS